MKTVRKAPNFNLEHSAKIRGEKIMRRILNNRVYDTKTAKKIVAFKNEALFEKRTGETFLYNKNQKSIKPLSYNQADDWCKKNFDKKLADFTQEGDVRMLVTLPSDIYTGLKRIAGDEAEYTSVNAVINKLLGEGLQKRDHVNN